MKKICLLVIASIASIISYGQDVKQSLATAKTSYASGNLEDAHFALQQSLQNLDIVIGKEVIKLLPDKMDNLKANTADDNVNANVGFVGATIHREYDNGTKKANIEIINNSPLLTSLNAFLTSPLLAGLGSDGKSKVLKVQGYKARLTKEADSDTNKSPYRLEIPFSNALLTLNVDNSSENEILGFANTLPLDKIAKLIQ